MVVLPSLQGEQFALKFLLTNIQLTMLLQVLLLKWLEQLAFYRESPAGGQCELRFEIKQEMNCDIKGYVAKLAKSMCVYV